jgi:hypothetical protein
MRVVLLQLSFKLTVKQPAPDIAVGKKSSLVLLEVHSSIQKLVFRKKSLFPWVFNVLYYQTSPLTLHPHQYFKLAAHLHPIIRALRS